MKKTVLASSAGFLSLAQAPRAVHAAPRADASDPKTLMAEIAKAFEEFKATNDAKGAERDGLVQAKIEGISATISTLEAALDDANRRIAAGAVGVGDKPKSADPEYASAFMDWFKTGEGDSQIRSAQFSGPRAALSEGSATDGGYLAPVEWDRSIINKLKLRSPIRENATVISITKAGFSKLFNDRVVGSGWVGETAARPATATPQLTSLAFAIGELYANPAATQTILDDAEIDLEAWLAAEVEEEFSVQENIAFLSGNGTNKPTGILNYVTGGANAATHPWGAIATTTVAGAAAITTDEVIDLVYALPTERNANAKFFMNRASVAKVRKLKDGQGNYIWQPTYVAGEPATLMGYPIVETPGMPNMTTGLVSILFGDMERTYLVIDRIGIRVLRDPYTNKPYVHFYTTKRVGGGVQNPEYMRAIKQA